jgi:hypothetical protein
MKRIGKRGLVLLGAGLALAPPGMAQAQMLVVGRGPAITAGAQSRAAAAASTTPVESDGIVVATGSTAPGEEGNVLLFDHYLDPDRMYLVRAVSSGAQIQFGIEQPDSTVASMTTPWESPVDLAIELREEFLHLGMKKYFWLIVWKRDFRAPETLTVQLVDVGPWSSSV